MVAKLTMADLHIGQKLYVVKRNNGLSKNRYSTWSYVVVRFDKKNGRVLLRTGINECDWHSDVSKFVTKIPQQIKKAAE